MRLLLDTHAFLWWLAGNTRMPVPIRTAILNAGDDVHVSAASAWEIATKFRLGRLPQAAAVAADVRACLAQQGFVELPITIAHGQAAGALAGAHRDPFDRMLIAQAMIENMVLVSNEKLFDSFGVKRLW